MAFVFASCSSDKEELHDGDKPESPKSQFGNENGHEWVDLNLPSGQKWATMNVGATSVTGLGNYYAWGETKAYKEDDQSNARNYSYAGKTTKTFYYWSTYKWSNDDEGNSFSKYTTSTTTLEPEDDAATQNWGGAWRMPTKKEFEELINNCYSVWTSDYNGTGITGYILYAAKSASDRGVVIARGDEPSSNYSLLDVHIFLRTASFRTGYKYGSYSDRGYYWTSSLLDTCEAYALVINPWHCGRNDNDYSGSRCSGFNVRAVCK